MIRATVITLVPEEPRGVFEATPDNAREIFAEIRSVRNNEFYQALAQGIEPSFIFRLTDYSEYQGEKLCIYNGQYYRIIRTYTPVNGQVIDLTVQKVDKFVGGGGT